MMRALLIAAALPLAILPAAPATAAGCRIKMAGTKCVIVPAAMKAKAEWKLGDSFPVYDHSMLIDPQRHGLPPVKGAWRYYRVGDFVYKVDARSTAVLEVLSRP